MYCNCFKCCTRQSSAVPVEGLTWAAVRTWEGPMSEPLHSELMLEFKRHETKAT